MTPSLSVATDNVYKFACLFGLALVIVAVFSFVSVYNSSLGEKVKRQEALIALQSKDSKTAADEQLTKLNERMIEVIKENERVAHTAIQIVLTIGLLLTILGGLSWHKKIQIRDDEIASIQLQKLRLELKKLDREVHGVPNAAEDEGQDSGAALAKPPNASGGG